MTDRPNILLIFTDQHRLSGVGCYGPTPCHTPHLDALAATGVRFETAYTCCPVCSPARASIMTGLYPHQHGILSNVHNLGCSVHELPDTPALLSRRLQTAGYRCGYSGKWHLGSDATVTRWGSPNTPSLPKDVGFDGQNFPGHGNGGFGYPEYNAYLAQHGFSHHVLPGPANRTPVMRYGITTGPVESTVDYFLADNTINLIDRYAAEQQPFFIWHNFWGPHTPYYVPREFYEMYANVAIPEWPNYRWPANAINRPHRVKVHPHMDRLTWDDWAEGIRFYYAFCTLIDQQIGRLLAHLAQRGLADNTLVVFAADHGETLGSHGGLTDKGWHHFEEIQRIPLIVRPPAALRGAHAPGTVLPQWASLLDLYPTFLEAAGAEPADTTPQGISLLPLLRGTATGTRDTAFVEFFGVNDLAASMITCRADNLKYGWNAGNGDELYDLARDPHEQTNLIDEPAHAAALAALRERLRQFMRTTGYPTGMFNQSRMGMYNG